MIRILHIVPFLDGGGVENLLLNYYKRMDKNSYKFDFIVHGSEIGSLESVFESYGSKIFHIPPKRENLKENLRRMKSIINKGDYDVIHVHQGIMSFIPIYYARKCGIKVRIAHSHMDYKERPIFMKIIDTILLPILKNNATHWFACGRDAGKSLWGKKAVDEGKVFIMKNAIEVDRFKFNSKVREDVRRELGLDGKFVIGNVARLSYQKNHEFLIRVFNDIYKKNKDSVLLLVGKGELEIDINNLVKELDLQDAVKFLGIRDDVHRLLQGMDIFVLPSRYEGLPVAMIETQASSLMSIISDCITDEVKATNLIKFVSLEETYEFWSDKILEYYNGYKRYDTKKEMEKSGYDISNQVTVLEDIYNLSEQCI